MLAVLALASSGLRGTSDFFAGLRSRTVSPPATPSRIGTTAPRAAIGETTPIVPDASAA